MTSRRRLAARKAALAALATIDRIGSGHGHGPNAQDPAFVALARALDALYGPLPPPTVLEEAVRGRWGDNPRSDDDSVVEFWDKVAPRDDCSPGVPADPVEGERR